MRRLLQLKNYKRRLGLVHQRLPPKCPRSPSLLTLHLQQAHLPHILGIRNCSPDHFGWISTVSRIRQSLEVHRMRSLVHLKNYTRKPDNLVQQRLPPRCPQHTVLILFRHYTYSKLTSRIYWESGTVSPTASARSPLQNVFASPSPWRDSLRSGTLHVRGPPHAESSTTEELQTKA